MKYNIFLDLPAGEALEKNVDDALEMINTYNKRLSDEMEARKSVAKLLHDFISHQKDHLSQTEETLEVCNFWQYVHFFSLKF